MHRQYVHFREKKFPPQSYHLPIFCCISFHVLPFSPPPYSYFLTLFWFYLNSTHFFQKPENRERGRGRETIQWQEANDATFLLSSWALAVVTVKGDNSCSFHFGRVNTNSPPRPLFLLLWFLLYHQSPLQTQRPSPSGLTPFLIFQWQNEKKTVSEYYCLLRASAAFCGGGGVIIFSLLINEGSYIVEALTLGLP